LHLFPWDVQFPARVSELRRSTEAVSATVFFRDDPSHGLSAQSLLPGGVRPRLF
jgi:hypothetical protein